jgi:Isopropylmalate/homocitrate/citramalate synthases
MKKNFKILDCTLRDGGYVNNWMFSENTYHNIILGLQQAGVDTIEVGIMGHNKENNFSTKFSCVEEIPEIMKAEGSNTIFTVMLTLSESKDIVIPQRTKGMVDGIRLAYFKEDYSKALDYAGELMNKGYLVYMQPMATFMYSEQELIEMVKQMNQLRPFGFYMVDSFGMMYTDTVENMSAIINEYLNRDILFGFHAHNNIQMAYANVIRFIELNKEREISIDASIYGMGRGAGNVNLELLMEYDNKKHNGQYNTDIILELYDRYLKDEYRENYWGYSGPYFLTAQKQINAVYIWYLNKKGIHDMTKINEILTKLPESAKHTLVKDVVDKIMEEG